MMYFAVPLISKEAAMDWGAVTYALHQTLNSIFNSSDSRFRVIIACHDIPEVPTVFDGRVQFLQLDTPVPRRGRGAPERKERGLDKSRKRMRVGQYLRGCEAGHVMFLDADDLIDYRLVRYVHEESAANGYSVRRGYQFDVASQELWLVDDIFNQVCGSCAIFWFNGDDLPKDYNDDCYFRKFLGREWAPGGQQHGMWESMAAAYNRPLQPIDFPAVIRTFNNGASTFYEPKSTLKRLRIRGVKRTIEYKMKHQRVPISRELVNRFQLQAYANIPHCPPQCDR